MKKYFLPILVAIFALGLSASAAYFSVLGLTKLFAGAVVGTAIVCSFIEGAKLIIASVLHQYGKKIGILTNVFLVISLLVAMSITSMGVYGYLTNAYQSTANKLEIIDGKVNVLNLKRERFNSSLASYENEKAEINTVISELTKGLSNNTIQYKDRETGQIITTTSSSTRKILKAQLDDAKIQREKLSKNIETLTDSITKLDIKILDINSNNEVASEIGPLKFIQKLTNVPMEKIINILTLVIVLVVDPLAIVLVIVFNKITEREKKENKNIIQKNDIEKEKPVILEVENLENDIEPESEKEPDIEIQDDNEINQKAINKDLYGDGQKGRKPTE